MKVTALRTTVVYIPLDQPVRSAQSHVKSVACALVYLDTDAGITGEGYTFSINGKRIRLFEEMIQSLESVVVGLDPWATTQFIDKAWADVVFIGRKGLSLFGISAIDMALWDLKGKDAGQPIAKLLGGARTEVPLYASSGMWLSSSNDELKREATAFLRQGFKAMKMRVGNSDINLDVARVAAVREIIGPDIDLMVDASQSMDVSRALTLSRALSHFNLVWFEEPVPADDPAGLATVAAGSTMPIATGENAFTHIEFHTLLQMNSATVLMPDLHRVGGFSEMQRVAQMAKAKNAVISPHLFTEYSLQVVAGLSNTNYLEHVNWFAPLFENKLELKDGKAILPDRPGNGFPFSQRAIEKYRV